MKEEENRSMSRMNRSNAILMTGFLAVLSASPLLATEASQAQPVPPVPSEPGATSASYGDWILRCQRGGGDKPVRLCEAAQIMQVQGQSQPIAQVAIGRPGSGQLSPMSIVLPASVAFPSSVHVQVDEKDLPGFELAWSRCLPGACVAEGTVKDDVLKRWRGASTAGRITYRNAAGQDLAIRLSFRGLAQALDAMAKESP